MMTKRKRGRGDDGVTLLLALLVITVVAVVSAALLDQSFTNTATTIATRQVAATQYSADAAAKYATNQLRLSDLSSGLCSSSTAVTSEDLANFYPSGVTTVAQKAHVDCAPDSNNGVPTGDPGSCHVGLPCPNSGPGTALLTLDSIPGETGIYVNTSGSAGPVRIRGGIFSNSKINAVGGGLKNTWCPGNPPGIPYDCTKTTPKTYVMARGTCTGSGGISFSQTGASSQCSYASTTDPRGADPGVPRTGYTPATSFNTPAAPAGTASSQSCKSSGCTADVGPTPGPASSCTAGAKYQQVLPGRIAGAAGLAFLNGLTGCSNAIIQFTPGNYYFDLPSPWVIPDSTVVVGGTFAAGYNPVAGTGTGGWPTNYNNGDFADACVAPGASGSSTTSGVRFVVGGLTQFVVNGNGTWGSHLAMCASNSSDGPPIVLYGLKTSIGSGSTLVSASNLCHPSGTGTTACALIQTANSPKTSVNIVGMTYTTRSTIDINLNNSSSKVFYWGVVSYAIEFGSTGSADLSANLVDVQNTGPSPFSPLNRFYLNVFTCPVSAGSCPASGASPDVRAVVQAGVDLAGNDLPGGNILVLGWSVKR